MQPEEYGAKLLDAMGASVDSSLVRSLPTLDMDGPIRELHQAHMQQAARVQRAASPSVPVAETPPPQPDEPEDSEYDNEDEDEAPSTCDAGGPIPADKIAVGLSVAVPFRVDGRDAYCAGTVRRLKQHTAVVVFDDGTWTVNFDRMFEVR